MLKLSEQFRAVVRTNCFHYNGRDASCGASGTLYMVLFGLVEIVLSQFPNLEKITLLSVIAAVMSFTYSFIGLFLSIAKFASHHSVRGTLLGVKIGVDSVSASTKTWHSLQALGNIAFAYTYAMLLIEIQVVPIVFILLMIQHSIHNSVAIILKRKFNQFIRSISNKANFSGHIKNIQFNWLCF